MERQGDGRKYEVLPMKGIWVTRFSRLREFEEKAKPGIHWYRESFWQPTKHSMLTEKDWCFSLANFEPRLKNDEDSVTNVFSKGYLVNDGVRYPSGHSSGSYVFDLQNSDVFDRIVYSLDE